MGSSVGRASIFFVLNMPAGPGWATRAMTTELVFRALASGVLGSLTQALRYSRPRLGPLMILPAVGHAAAYVVHLHAGTPRLGASIAASIAFSVLATAFTMFAMRRGALIVGPGQQSFAADLARLPRLIVAFVASGAARHATDTAYTHSRCIQMPQKTLHLTNAYHEHSGGIRTMYHALLEEANRAHRLMRLVVPGKHDREETCRPLRSDISRARSSRACGGSTV